MLQISCVVFWLLLAVVICEKIRFDNFSLYKIMPENDKEVKLLQNIQNTDAGYDFWTDPVRTAGFVSVLSNPQDKEYLENILKDNKIRYSITIKNVQEVLDKEKVGYTRGGAQMSWDAYYNLDQIYSWLDALGGAYPNLVNILDVGHSFEGRPIKGIKISHGSGRRAIFIEGGIHSREWISPASTCFIINELLTSSDEETQAAAKDYDWYIFPITNPDGYVWSHEQNRMWRKNRRPITANAIGVDLNRNWNNNWLVAGVSSDPASDSYGGPGPFSELETRALSSFLISIGDKIDLYLSFHSFSQLLLIPFGNSTDPYSNYNDAMNIGRRAMGALTVRYGTQYTTGNIAEAIYTATGGSIDWVKDRLKVPLVYCYELRDDGHYGFLLPTNQILPNNLEMMDSVLDLIHQAKRFGYLRGGNK